MKPVLTLVAGIAGLAAVFLFQAYVPVILLILSVSCVLMILAGTAIPVNSVTRRVGFESTEKDVEASRWRCFEGRKLDPSKYHSFVVSVQMARIWRLGVLGIMALVEAALVIATYSNPFQAVRAMGFDYYLFFFLCLGAMAQAAIAANWLLERRLLGTFGFAVGDFHPPTGRYIFRDNDGNHRGGTVTPASCHHEDNTCLVFYAPEHPDSNIPSFRLLFHKLVLR